MCHSEYDLDCDGATTVAEWPPCLDCEVRCVTATVDAPPGMTRGTWDCTRDGLRVPLASFHGFGCSSSESVDDYAGLRIVCPAVGVPAYCIREEGPALPTDLPLPRCLGVE